MAHHKAEIIVDARIIFKITIRLNANRVVMMVHDYVFILRLNWIRVQDVMMYATIRTKGLLCIDPPMVSFFNFNIKLMSASLMLREFVSLIVSWSANFAFTLVASSSFKDFRYWRSCSSSSMEKRVANLTIDSSSNSKLSSLDEMCKGERDPLSSSKSNCMVVNLMVSSSALVVMIRWLMERNSLWAGWWQMERWINYLEWQYYFEQLG